MSNNITYKPIDYNNYNLRFPEVDKLLDRIEIIKRRKIKDSDQPINYIDPLNHVKTLKNPVNHLIIGRRGSGKTSLLIKVIEEIKKTKGLITSVDMQSFQRLSKDLPLVEVLLRLFKDIKEDIENNKNWKPYIQRKAETKYYKLKSFYFGLIKKELWTNDILEIDMLFSRTILIIEQLEKIKNTPNGTSIQVVKQDKRKRNDVKKINLASSFSADSKYLELIKAKGSLDSSYNITQESEIVNENETKFSRVYSKQEALDELKFDMIRCLDDFYKLNKRSVYLILDDFYQIPIDTQPYIFQFLHDINKETKLNVFSYKACLVPHRFKLNEDNNKILSHKDDFSTINLDREFYELEDNKDLLFKILCGIDANLGFTSNRIQKLFNDKLVLNDCVRASGALPRYFLDVFSHMVKYSLAENQTKIHRMVFCQVVREIKKSKDELIGEEAYLPEKIIRQLYSIIEKEIVQDLQTNVVLYPYNSFKNNEGVLNSLINLGYLHRIKENIVVNKINYVPLFIDMIFTHTKSNKMPPKFRDVKFWTQQGKNISKCPVWEFKADNLSIFNNETLN